MDEEEIIVPVEGVSLDEHTLSVDLSSGDIHQLTAIITPEDATNKGLRWSSSDENVITFDELGTMYALSPGECDVTVTTDDGNFTDTCHATVTASIIAVTLDQTMVYGEAGDEIQLNATIYPENTTDDKTLTWVSEDETIATVDENGLVNILVTGNVLITVATVNNKIASCSINPKIYPEYIEIYPEVEQYVLNESIIPPKFDITFFPYDTTERTITWDSSNKSVATIDENGEATCLTPGYTTIKAYDILNHEVEAGLEVYQRYEKPDPPEITSVGKFEIVVTPVTNCRYSIDGVNWTENNRFSGLHYGTNYNVYIRKRSNGYYLESEPSDPTVVTTLEITHVESIELSEKEIIIPVGGENTTYQLSYTIYPADADEKSVIWASSNPNNIEVDQYGTVTVKKEAEAIITVTTTDGGKQDTCVVRGSVRWDKPDPPVVVDVNNRYVILGSADNYAYSLDKVNWTNNNRFTGLVPNTAYMFYWKRLATGTKLESEVSNPVSTKTLIDPKIDPATMIQMTSVTLTTKSLYFNIDKFEKVTLNYVYTPSNANETNVYWYSEDPEVCIVDGFGIVTPTGTGKTRVYVRSIMNNQQDSCIVEVHKKRSKPDIPTVKDGGVQLNSIELNPVEGCEYSIDNGKTWQDSTLFDGLTKNSFYEFVQRYKKVSDYELESEKSNGRTVKTLNDEESGGTSESGYILGQTVEVKNIEVYCAPYSKVSSKKISGDYYIFDIRESNGRIRITDNKSDVNTVGNCLGWVRIDHLSKVITDIYVGDKVIVNGAINTNLDGSGQNISKEKIPMFVTDIFEGYPYKYGVASYAGSERIGFAKESDVRKYDK